VKTLELRKIFFEQIVKRYVFCETRYTQFNNEMESWKIQGILNDIFAVKE
jgi:hypothetical protein